MRKRLGVIDETSGRTMRLFPLFQRGGGARQANEQRAGDRVAAEPATPLVYLSQNRVDSAASMASTLAMRDEMEAATALRTLDLLALHSSGVPLDLLVSQLTRTGEPEANAMVARVLERLFESRQIAGCGTTFCLPEQVETVRRAWLIGSAIGGAPRDERAQEAVRRLRGWDGWNMPVCFEGSGRRAH